MKLVAALVGLLVASPALADDPAGSVTNPAQISLRGMASATQQIDAASQDAARPEPLRQLSEPHAPPSQAQVTAAGRTAEPSPPLSHRAEGRDVRQPRVEGSDACDPERLRDAPQSRRAACEHTLERRAEEFAHPVVRQPSAEERLLAYSAQLNEPGANASAAARVLGRGAVDQSGAAQAIAAQTLPDADQGPSRDRTPPLLAPDWGDLLDAIARGGGMFRPPPPH
ncbi:hypothetical protein DJ021_14790 [Phenylobacterium hankyongense]|uniref:Uncharacterized protein n=1 Tax=Phenylobacterium hankyongense TaxID=1813876 RepID=A0A328B535_9CAUL|nr:hypothetical protein [Phenylobacterium hankyongense]RAK60984.1 hypothetical protein DJ021_14790 [Phenylobacterium hankyongense]